MWKLQHTNLLNGIEIVGTNKKIYWVTSDNSMIELGAVSNEGVHSF